MKRYFTPLLLFLSLFAYGCRAPRGWNPERIREETISSTPSAEWHLFANINDASRRLFALSPRPLPLPVGVRSLHVAGKRGRFLILEGESSLPAFTYRFLGTPKNWIRFPSTCTLGLCRRGIHPRPIHLNLPGTGDLAGDLLFALRTPKGGWEGWVSLDFQQGAWHVAASMPLNHALPPIEERPDAPLTLVSAPGSPFTGWLLGRRAPSITLAVTERGALIRVGKKKLTVGNGIDDAGTRTLSPATTLFFHYDRHAFRYPQGLRVPGEARHLLAGVDLMDVMCENEGSLEVCRGTFILKE